MQTTMRLVYVSALLLTSACGESTGVDSAQVPKAFIRFVNAMPDTLGVDFHAVDVLENSPYIATSFGDIRQPGYTPVAAGERHFREFLSNPNAPIASTVSQVLVDTTLHLLPGAHYTLLHAGFARSGQTPVATFLVIEDDIPTPAAGQIAVRVMNLAAGIGSVDVYASASSTGPLPATPVLANATYLVPTAYVNMATST